MTTAAPSTKAPPSAAGGVTVWPVVNTFRILRYLIQSGAPERSVDVARHLSINPSTCFNILRTLVAEEVIDFDPLSKTYSSGQGLARLVDQMMLPGQRLELALPLLHRLAVDFGVTATLWRRLGEDRIVLVSSESSPTELHIDMPAGQRLPILMGASGRLFAGRLGLSETQLREAFDKLRWARPLGFDTYQREVEFGQRHGWAIDDGYFATGVLAIAAPVCDRSGGISFTVSTVMIRGAHDQTQIDAIGAAVSDLGRQLEAILFY
jgi:DNA-binding IclR family transcriptional regulator